MPTPAHPIVPHIDAQASSDAQANAQATQEAQPKTKAPKAKGPTLAQAKTHAKAHGCTLTHKDGEYRVCPIGGSEAQALYTNDRADAMGTAAAMDAVRAVRRVETLPQASPAPADAQATPQASPAQDVAGVSLWFVCVGLGSGLVWGRGMTVLEAMAKAKEANYGRKASSGVVYAVLQPKASKDLPRFDGLGVSYAAGGSARAVFCWGTARI